MSDCPQLDDVTKSDHSNWVKPSYPLFDPRSFPLFHLFDWFPLNLMVKQREVAIIGVFALVWLLTTPTQWMAWKSNKRIPVDWNTIFEYGDGGDPAARFSTYFMDRVRTRWGDGVPPETKILRHTRGMEFCNRHLFCAMLDVTYSCFSCLLSNPPVGCGPIADESIHRFNSSRQCLYVQ